MSEIHEIEHIADWAIRVRAPDAGALFAAAARGMFGLLIDSEGVTADREIAVRLAAEDRETLLIDWLNELLFQSEQTGVVFTEFSIERLHESPAPLQLEARARGGRPPTLARAIKAATFAGLEIAPVDGVLEATIVFDV